MPHADKPPTGQSPYCNNRESNRSCRKGWNNGGNSRMNSSNSSNDNTRFRHDNWQGHRRCIFQAIHKSISTSASGSECDRLLANFLANRWFRHWFSNFGNRWLYDEMSLIKCQVSTIQDDWLLMNIYMRVRYSTRNSGKRLSTDTWDRARKRVND